MAKAKKKRGITKRLIETITSRYGVSPQQVLSKRRKQKFIKPRYLIAYLLREDLGKSYPQIGRILGNRDHTTIRYAYLKIKVELSHSLELQKEVENIRGSLEGEVFLPRKSSKLQKDPKNARTVEIPHNSQEIMLEQMRATHSSITGREKRLLEEWRAGKTLAQIGEKEDVTRERIRQIIKKALLKELKKKITDGLEIDIKEFLTYEKMIHSNLRDVDKLKEDSKTKGVEQPQRWSFYYARCKACGTTLIPHYKKGLCKKCTGVWGRERIIREAGERCESCGIDRGKARRESGKDLYIARFKNKNGGFSIEILCKNCFEIKSGKHMAARRHGLP
ncbi:MAG TPA: helix-turn-helix domain-containing protein [Candidatus Paceibacterota bacterium]